MKSHATVRLALSAFAILLSLATEQAMAAGTAQPTAQDLFRQMASASSDDCGPPVASPSTVDVAQSEDRLFNTVDALVTDLLNGPKPAQTSDAESRAKSALLAVERSSAEINKSWPAEARFHFEVLALNPAILVRMSYRYHAKLAMFGVYDLNRNASVDPGTKWREVSLADPNSPTSSIDLFPLHRGPGGRARFLARVWNTGCAGSIGEAYYGYEWSADGELATQIIKIEGAQGMDQAESKQVGKLSTTGKTIQLPYCFFSVVDSWDNPTLCAADTFDLSGDAPRFIGRVYNSPDLVVVKSAIQHAQARDYVALRAYCTSDAVARKLIREIPPGLGAEELETVKTGPAREKVVLSEGSVDFTLIERRGEWRLESFTIADDR